VRRGGVGSSRSHTLEESLARRVLVLTELGCGETWARSGGVEVPLHRDLMGLNPKDSPCTLSKPEWEKRCTKENHSNYAVCPKGCPISGPETDTDSQEQ
jgi:hypothetical protein